MDTPHASRIIYRGRLAPSPTGFLHLGHARTFWIAQQRARSHGGTLVLRNEDPDLARCRPQFVAAMIEDLSWFGFEWQEGPDCGGDYGPYSRSERHGLYLAKRHDALSLRALQARGISPESLHVLDDVVSELGALDFRGPGH